MSYNYNSIVGLLFGSLLVKGVQYLEAKRQWYADVLCSCGQQVVRPIEAVASGKITDCGGCNAEENKVGGRHRRNIPPGTRFGNLVVVEEGEPKRYTSNNVARKSRQFLCMCDCGDEITVEMRTFYRPRVSHSNCTLKNLKASAKYYAADEARKRQEEALQAKRQELVGTRFGRWTVIGNDQVGRNKRVAVQCDCGSKREVFLAALRTGRSQSCGCLRAEQQKGGKRRPAAKTNGGKQ